MMIGGPGALGFAVLGLLTTAVLRSRADVVLAAVNPSWLRSPTFEVVGLVPASSYLLGFFAAAAAGSFLRRPIAGLVVGGALLVLVTMQVGSARDHFVEWDREVAPLSEDWSHQAAGVYYVALGYLDAQGNTVDFDYSCLSRDIRSNVESRAETARCQQEQGIVARYRDSLTDDKWLPVSAIYSLVQLAAASAAAGIGLFRYGSRDV